ncbi:DUF1178 family protein [Roseovarius ramblicola]|uniref:DUF1178 family protein n=1 Tax=Roseovarius ramblicola TaxID=2022336 RepID=A0ABV5I664_9RHOB
MIKFTLKCERGHRFDSWFQSASAFDRLSGTGMVACAVCGSTQVEKALMTPQVQGARDDRSLSSSPDTAELAIAALRRKVEANADYVGTRFAQEVRDMHDGVLPERAIYGEARPEEAKRLFDDGIPVAPLPFSPRRKTH